MKNNCRFLSSSWSTHDFGLEQQNSQCLQDSGVSSNPHQVYIGGYGLQNNALVLLFGRLCLHYSSTCNSSLANKKLTSFSLLILIHTELPCSSLLYLEYLNSAIYCFRVLCPFHPISSPPYPESTKFALTYLSLPHTRCDGIWWHVFT